jgi:hypothetical protein
MVPPVDLRTDRAFPTFLLCSDDNSIDLDYYATNDGSYYHPKRRWCLLAEIIEVEIFIRPRLTVRDRSGKQFIVAFYLDNDVEFDRSMYRIGHTIAVLYPHQHHFLDLSVGIRQENLESVQVSMY